MYINCTLKILVLMYDIDEPSVLRVRGRAGPLQPLPPELVLLMRRILAREPGFATPHRHPQRPVSADTAARLGRYFGTAAHPWLDMQGQHDIALVRRERGKQIAARVRPAGKA